ncbi:MAG: GNAT family N-acetyltransferase [Dehalococcoidia bacterium]|nr:GNAT family N-acetyltransferase [Dehalococcoidia bacterium]
MADLKNQRLFVAVEGGSVLGFIILNERNRYAAEISWLAVKSEYHRRGIGTALIATATAGLKRGGTRILEVKTLADTASGVSQ